MRKHAKPAVQRLSSADRRRLERALSVAREARLYRRTEAVLLVAEGQSMSEAARRVRATRLALARFSREPGPDSFTVMLFDWRGRHATPVESSLPAVNGYSPHVRAPRRRSMLPVPMVTWAEARLAQVVLLETQFG